MRVLSNEEVAALLPMEAAIDLVEKAMVAVSAGGANLPLRSLVHVGGDNNMGVMPGAILPGEDREAVFGVKLLSLFPANPDAGYSSHEGAYVLFEGRHGTAAGMMNAGLLTAIRTAAASAVATRALATPGAETLALIGAGEQAGHHLDAMRIVMPSIRRVLVAGRREEKRDAFVARMRERHRDISIEPAADVRGAVAGTDIVCTVTSSAEPVLMGDWIGPGVHLNVVGASIPSKREIDAELVGKASLFVDYRPSTFAQAGEVIAAIEAGLISRDYVRAEIGEVISGKKPGRASREEITLYRSLGIAAQDLACAAHCVREARARGLGVEASL